MATNSNCENCEVCTINEIDTPFIALGKCVKWDTVCTNGQYEVVEGSNVAAILNLHADITWTSDVHGETVVCFDGVSQLKQALEERILKGWAVFLK